MIGFLRRLFAKRQSTPRPERPPWQARAAYKEIRAMWANNGIRHFDAFQDELSLKDLGTFCVYEWMEEEGYVRRINDEYVPPIFAITEKGRAEATRRERPIFEHTMVPRNVSGTSKTDPSSPS